nr:hypothetical protein [Candidatus Sigynarchaeota archaeon]
INDAPALARADVGIAMGGGTDVAIESGELIVMKDDPVDAVSAIQLSNHVLGRIKLNLFWAFAYNSALIPIAIFGVVAPELAGLIMAMSSVTVVSLSLLLKGYVPPVKKPFLIAATIPSQLEAPGVALAADDDAPDAPRGPVLKCNTCEKTMPVPIHCNQPMHVENFEGKDVLVCWMGAECGIEDIPVHCGKAMILKDGNLEKGSGVQIPAETKKITEETQENEMNETMMKGMKPPADYPSEVKLKCQKCGATQDAPKHCGRPMTIQKVDGKSMLVCWMGPGCGKAEIPAHCGMSMK